MIQKKLYVLCVGINRFKAVPDLNGCENDATNVYNYLETSSTPTEYEMDGKLLLSEEATKENLVNTFFEHLGQATAGDVAVFYFSGHGAEEKADEVFHPFLSKEKITTIVCHDSRTDGVTDLADKELRYMINKVSGKEPGQNPHFVLITDSCHSGGATRSELTPRLTGESDLREWKDYIFADEISRESVANAVSLKDVLPEGEHIHLSSCEDVELAYEIDGTGIFTSHMLDILNRSAGKVTYSDINGRTRLLLGGRFPQKPTIYGTNSQITNSLFLGGASENVGMKGNVAYNAKSNNWKIDLGAVHGLMDSADNPTIVRIINYEEEEIAKATVDTTSISDSVLAIDPEALNARVVRKNETYTGIVENVFRPHISFCFAGEEEGVELLKNYFGKPEKIESLNRRNIKIVENETQAQYVIRSKTYPTASDGQFLVTLPYDSRPLVRQLFYHGKSSFKTLEALYFGHIVQWEFIRNLYNGKSRLTPTPSVEIRIYKVINDDDPSQDKLLVPVNDEVMIDNLDSIRIEVVNNNRRKKLYYTLFFMSQLFEIWPISDKNAYLDSGKSYWVQEREAVEFELEEYKEQFNYENGLVHWKCVFSTAPVNLHDFEQEALDEPVYPALGADDEERPIDRRKRPDSDDWGTHSVTIVIKNDKYEEGKIVG